uniref:Microtubule-associated protein futsch n=1 Tax=Rhodnius prolixus TaxID=13249 RepID=T1HAN9_RHOPR
MNCGGLITWDKDACHVDLEKELQTITSQAPEGEEAKNGERLIQFASENLVTEVLIHPQLNTLVQCMRNLLSSFTRHRHIVHAGYACAGNGAWMVQDGTYSFADFADMYQEMEVQRVLRAYENTVTVDIHCCQEGDWNNLKPSSKDHFSKISTVRLNPNDKMSSVKAIHDFLDYLSPYIVSASLEELLESSDVVGNIRFSHPTLYVFPGGQGDAALFGINGFNMLVDGGFSRKACFWDFTRHLDRLDAVLMTRVNNGNVQGLASLLQRKKVEQVYPQIGHFFCNMQERRQPLSPDGDKDRDPLLINLIDLGQEMLTNLRQLQLKPQLCIRDSSMDPINLYHKVGHGKLDMYVLSPSKESRELKDFLAKWNAVDSKIFCSYNKKGGEFTFPLCNRISICALLVWQPANPEDNITRLLFPGSTPQQKIFEGLDRLRNLEFMKHPVCSAKSLSPSASSVGLNIRTASRTKVPAIIDKIPENEIKQGKPSEAVKPAVKVSATTGISDKVQKQVSAKPAKPKAEKTKEKPKTDVETKIETVKQDKIKPSEAVQKEKQKEKPRRTTHKQAEKKIQKTPSGDKKSDSIKSSPTTPKKIAENKLIETAAKTEMKPRASTRTKPSPSATPAKSAKEANNRKVMEQKTREIYKSQKAVAKRDEKKIDKVPPTRKSVPSPSKTIKTTSPIKTAKASARQKQEVKKAMKADKDLPTDSSAVSTPSTVDAELTGIKGKDEMIEKEGLPATDSKSDDAKDVAEEKPPTISKEEEDEILIIEKIELAGAESGKGDVESIAMHIQKGEKKEEVVEKEVVEKLEEDTKEKKETSQSPEGEEVPTDALKKEEILPETLQETEPSAKVKLDVQKPESQEASVAREIPSTDRIITPKDVKEKPVEVIEQKQADESQPDEKFSTTVESGATTTAPTLPEDERIPLDEIKEGIEEKYIKEETKEKDIGQIQRPEQPTSLPEVPKISGTLFDQRAQLLKDIVKTPDEVADLPVHEEADAGIYVGADVVGKEIQKSKEDLLSIPAGKKPSDKKETEAAEELKFIKDGLEKEDKSKDLKEDLISSDQISATIPTDISSGERLETKDESEDKIQEEEHLLEKEDGIPPEKPQSPKEEIEKLSEEELEDKLIDEGIDEAEEIQREEKDIKFETKKEMILEQDGKDKDLGIIADETEAELPEKSGPVTVDAEKLSVQDEKSPKEEEIVAEGIAGEVLEITREKLPCDLEAKEQPAEVPSSAIKAKRDSLDEALILDKDDDVEIEEIEEKIVSDTMEKEKPVLQKTVKTGKPTGEVDELEEKEIDEAEEHLEVDVGKPSPAEDETKKDLDKQELLKLDEISKDIEKFEEEETKEIELKPKDEVKAETVEQEIVLEEAVEVKEQLIIEAKESDVTKEKAVGIETLEDVDEKLTDIQPEKKEPDDKAKDDKDEKVETKQEVVVKEVLEDLKKAEIKEKEEEIEKKETKLSEVKEELVIEKEEVKVTEEIKEEEVIVKEQVAGEVEKEQDLKQKEDEKTKESEEIKETEVIKDESEDKLQKEVKEDLKAQEVKEKVEVTDLEEIKEDETGKEKKEVSVKEEVKKEGEVKEEDEIKEKEVKAELEIKATDDAKIKEETIEKVEVKDKEEPKVKEELKDIKEKQVPEKEDFREKEKVEEEVKEKEEAKIKDKIEEKEAETEEKEVIGKGLVKEELEVSGKEVKALLVEKEEVKEVQEIKEKEEDKMKESSKGIDKEIKPDEVEKKEEKEEKVPSPVPPTETVTAGKTEVDKEVEEKLDLKLAEKLEVKEEKQAELKEESKEIEKISPDKVEKDLEEDIEKESGKSVEKIILSEAAISELKEKTEPLEALDHTQDKLKELNGKFSDDVEESITDISKLKELPSDKFIPADAEQKALTKIEGEAKEKEEDLIATEEQKALVETQVKEIPLSEKEKEISEEKEVQIATEEEKAEVETQEKKVPKTEEEKKIPEKKEDQITTKDQEAEVETQEKEVPKIDLEKEIFREEK